MSVEENIQLMRRWFKEVWNDGKTETIYALLAPDAVATGQRDAEGELRGPDEFAEFVKVIRNAFPDIKLTIEDIFGSEDKVVVRWSATMTHSGEGLGVRPTGNRVRLTGISIARIANGRLVEGWDNWDQLGMMRQIGVYIQPGSDVLEKSA
jgi:steroid delta-isomerase-like uncharacterized protein